MSQRQTIRSSPYTWKIAKSGEGNVLCRRCSTPITRTQNKEMPYGSIRCSSCEAINMCDLIAEQHILIRPECVPIFDADQAKAMTWFHASSVNDWLPTVQKSGKGVESKTALVHIGTRAAAMERYVQQVRMNPDMKTKKWYLHEVNLPSAAIIFDDVERDLNSDELSIVAALRRFTGGYCSSVTAMRYVNFWEAIGSISMIVNPLFLEVSKSTLIK